MSQLPALQTEWDRLMALIGLGAHKAQPVFEQLIRRYREAGRYYHNLDHLAQVLAVIRRLERQASQPAAVLLAGWFHDAVYDPRAQDNEERSAELAGLLLMPLAIDPSLIQRVQQLILCTKTHQCGNDLDARVLLDADLSILGADPTEYARYAEAIRREYAWVPEEAYRLGRRTVLQSFRQRERIFQTEELFQEREIRARANLKAEIDDR
jgi:predicted metal-dependent HD superfamily phosphohydrolase